MKKIISVILFNILAIIFIWFLSDCFLYTFSLLKNDKFSLLEYKNLYKSTSFKEGLEKFYSKEINSNNINKYRLRHPEGLQYKSNPILLLGCSYAYGQDLENTQTFGYKLSDITKRPVYNISVPGTGFQHMYYITQNGIFDQKIPYCETVIWIIIGDNYRRMTGEGFFIADNVNDLHYSFGNGVFKPDYDNAVSNFLNTNYTFRMVKKVYNRFYLSDKHNEDKITDEALSYFVQTRDNLEKIWNKEVKFVIFIYDIEHLSEKLIPKLKQNNFVVITTNDLTASDLKQSAYTLPDGHPNEDAWNLLTPLFVKEMKSEQVL